MHQCAGVYGSSIAAASMLQQLLLLHTAAVAQGAAALHLNLTIRHEVRSNVCKTAARIHQHVASVAPDAALSSHAWAVRPQASLHIVPRHR